MDDIDSMIGEALEALAAEWTATEFAPSADDIDALYRAIGE